MINPKFNEAKERLITSAQRVAGAYLLSKYGSAHLSGESKVELTAKEGPTNSSFVFSGKITCFAPPGLLNNVGVNMTVNSNDIEVESETIQADITEALNAQRDHTDKVLAASLDGFKLTDNGTMYLKVNHSDLQDASLGVVGKNEYATSPNKSELLQSIVKDAMLETPISFTGEFKEPTIEKVAMEKQASKVVEARFPICRNCADGNCFACEPKTHEGHTCECPACNEKGGSKEKKSSWLTAELFKEADTIACPDCGSDMSALRDTCPKCADESKKEATLSIQENMPRAKSADHLAQSAQLEEQSDLIAQAKVEHEAANALLSLLQGMGYGSAKIVESSRSNDGIDFMAAIDDAGSVKAVSIPVVIKEAKVVLPKKSLISMLVSKGLDVKAKLAEQFDMDVLEKLAVIEEKIAYEANEVVSILNENLTVEKIAAGEKQPFFDSDDSTMTVQKHMLPDNSDLKVGDRLSDGTDSWEIVNQEGQQNDKNEGSSSQWTLKKVQGPEHDGKEPKNKIPS